MVSAEILLQQVHSLGNSLRCWDSSESLPGFWAAEAVKWGVRKDEKDRKKIRKDREGNQKERKRNGGGWL